MIALIWLAVWLLDGAPELQRWNAWLVSLLVILAVQLFSGGNRHA